MNDRSNAATVTERFAQVTQDDFETEVDTLWQAAGLIKDVVIERVAAGDIPPVTGLGIVSCITGQVFGYQQFHGQPSTTDLMSQLNVRAMQGNRS